MNADVMDENVYLELLHECFESLRDGTHKPLYDISEGDVEPRCDEAVHKHDEIGAEDAPQVNAAIAALSLSTEATMEHLALSDYETGDEYLAALAHGAAKRDLIGQVLDERKEAIKRINESGPNPGVDE